MNFFETEPPRLIKTLPNTLDVYTDGGCHNQGPFKGVGGWAYVILDQHGKVVAQKSGNCVDGTNNRTESAAVLWALSYILGHKEYSTQARIRIHSDSRYVVDIWTKYLAKWNGNFTGLANEDLLKSFWYYYRDLKDRVEFNWIKGHDGNKYNEYVDEVCTWEMEKITGPTKGSRSKTSARMDKNNE